MDGVKPILYIDAVEVLQSTLVGTDTTVWFSALSGIDNGRLGSLNQNSGGETNLWAGNLDEARFWNTNIGIAGITADYNLGAPTTPDSTGLVSNYRMGDGDTFPTITDNKGGNNGTLINMEAGDFQEDVPQAA